MAIAASPNFGFLAHHDERLAALGTQAEAHFAGDPTITLWKLRQLAEVLARHAVARLGLAVERRESLDGLIDLLTDARAINAQQRALFHALRTDGNAAVHESKGDHRTALHQLRMARELGVWFHRTWGNNRRFDPGPFVPPPEPAAAAAGADPALHAELARLRADAAARADELAAARREAEALRREAEAEALGRLTAEERAAKEAESAAIWAALAEDELAARRAAAAESQALAAANARLAAELASLQAAAAAAPAAVRDEVVARAAAASDAIVLDEAATRRIIDAQLRAADWEVDSETLRYAAGARPVRGVNRAIAEWPTASGPADYVLFAGLTAIGVVEAKRQHKDVSAVIEQARRYSRGFQVKGDEQLADGHPWGDLRVPFLFATNGRPFLRQLLTASGIWFLDARRAVNRAHALEGWYTPDGLLALLKQDVDAAEARLATEPMPYIDRAYQRQAILAAERALADPARRAVLIAMATGTGKTRMCIGLCYRLLKTRRFRRVLFLVDRTALGMQTADALKDLRLEQLATFTDIFEVKELGDLAPGPTTKLHIATVQAMVARVLGGDADGHPPPVDQYDCIVVDECHRGYLLDRELSDRDFQFRDEADYISKYRRVLDHFDAVAIGLTATPALHTSEIFGPPVFTYSYREAVVDGFLIDHEPPIRIVTELAADGIHYRAREEVLVLDRDTAVIRKETLADDVDFEIDAFNRRVITEPWNRAVLGELVRHLDPAGEEKTVVFCATDPHADLVVYLLKEAFAARLGAVEDAAVVKITGSADDRYTQLRRFRNERLPTIAVTVDLLTTGIDVPRIANLVFLRRVKSRVLYEQMIGRATRLCPEIHKERFRIFDAVDLYAAIQDVTDMKPVVVNPAVTFAQLAREIAESTDDDTRRQSIAELTVKLRRKARAFIGPLADTFAAAAGQPPREVLAFLPGASPDAVAAWLAAHPALVPLLDRVSAAGDYRVIVSQTADQVREVSRGYGAGRERPDDYLASFGRYLRDHGNRLPALLAVTQRPRDLTRADLRDLRLALDAAGYTEAQLQVAWRETRSEDIAATILGFIRQEALGSPLVPYAERVDAAVRRLQKAHSFTDPQRKWLQRIAHQMKLTVVVDRTAFDEGAFQADGGFTRIDRLFDGQLAALLGELADETWRDAG